MVEDEICHAYKHVFLDVGIKLPVYLSQNIGWGRIPRRLSAQHAAANRHDKRGGNAFARNVRDRHAKPFVIDLDVIKIIAAYLAGGHIKAADLKSVNGRRFGGKQNSLNIARDFEIVVESLLFIRHRVDNSVIESKGGLLGDRFKNNEIALRKWWGQGTIGDGKDA